MFNCTLLRARPFHPLSPELFTCLRAFVNLMYFVRFFFVKQIKDDEAYLVVLIIFVIGLSYFFFSC